MAKHHVYLNANQVAEKERIETDSVGIREKEIWNAAIEAATLRAKENGAHPNVLLKVMRLKK